ncbi:MAG: succinylglutamate-semialdehyde dehydrogenase [Pirellulaceae bacterium]|nr:succinylglutamate-semialdehyde dehydrogenase [Pirellulaceae bacterium]
MAEIKTCTGQQLIGSGWFRGRGADAVSLSPIDGRVIWQGQFADSGQADAAVGSAHSAFASWSLVSLADRTALCRAFASYVDAHRDELATLISWETGKPIWESLSEVATVIGKVVNAIDAQQARRWTTVERQHDLAAVTRYKPHGVMLVLGPFNLPAHLPGAHIVPALLAGNTVVFKPSELTPAVGQWLARAWHTAGLPTGVLNLVHGDATIAQQMASDARVAGVLFTGSYRAGASLHKLLGGHPEKVLALEMGGNNPLVVHGVADTAGAVMQIIESAFITSGQRCTCARRLIVTESAQPDRLLKSLSSAIGAITVGLPFDEPKPFMGTLIRPVAAERMLAAQAQLMTSGGRVLNEMHGLPASAALLTPGLIDVTDLLLEDVEHFGPMLCVTRVDTLEDAVQVANGTRFGLAAGLLADNQDDYLYFVERIRAGIVNWNRQTTGASGRLPFGGVGASGNHAPSGYFAADYCAYPVASLESERIPTATAKMSPGLEGAAQACMSN